MIWVLVCTSAAFTAWVVDSAQRRCEQWAYERDKDA
jgi:hypothetical protein